MFGCPHCDRSFETKAALGGHVGAHVRRGELKAQPAYVKYTFPRYCNKCNAVIQTLGEQIAHTRKHNVQFDSLKKDLSRKRRLLNELGCKCQICNLDSWNNQKIPIELDHIDGNPDNNVRENLRLLCPNCHAQQPTHAGANVKKFSKTKRQKIQRRYPNYRHHGHTIDEVMESKVDAGSSSLV